MSAIKNNPYRTLGLLGNSSERELQRQIATIKRFAEVGKVKAFDYDFPFLGEIDRNSERVQEAASKIEQAANKVHYVLFWFLKNGHIDDAALNNLKEGHIDKAAEIWNKILNDTIVTSKNFTAINNLSTLQLGIVTQNDSFDLERFFSSINLKAKLLLSDVFNHFITTVIGEGISVNHEIILKGFVDEVLQTVKPYLNKPNGIQLDQLLDAFDTFPNEIKQYISAKFTDRPQNNIENQIEIAKQKRDDNPQEAEKYGEELYKNTKKDLASLKTIWGLNNIQYEVIVNKLANEILQCAIDYYNYHQDNNSGIDPGDYALRLAKHSLSIGPTGQVKNRIEENLISIQEWVNKKPQRQQEEIVKTEISFITKQLLEFQKNPNSISIATNLVNSCKDQLKEIKLKLSSQNETYLNLSTAVANSAQNMVITVVNLAIERRNTYLEFLEQLKELYPLSSYGVLDINTLSEEFLLEVYFNRMNMLKNLDLPFSAEESLEMTKNTLNRLRYSLEELKSVIKDAWDATQLIGSLDMNSQQRGNYSKNRDTLKSIANQLYITISVSQPVSQNMQKSTGGCYIATMAYGGYEHPQVIELRKFRDNTLSKSALGRGFIKTITGIRHNLLSA